MKPRDASTESRSGTEPRSPGGSELLLGYLRLLLRFAPWKVWISIALMVVLGFTQGIGLLMLVPALRIIGIGDTGEEVGQASAWLVDLFQRTGIPLTLPVILVFYVLLVAVQAMATQYQQILNAELINGFTLFLRDRFSSALAHARWMTFVRARAADFTHVLTSETGRVASATRMMLSLPGHVLIACVQVGVAFTISPALTAAALACGACLLVVMIPYNRRVQQSGQALRDSTGSMYGSIMEFLAGMKVTKSYGLEATHLAACRRDGADIARQLVRYARTVSRAGMLFQIGTAVAISAFLFGAVTLASTPPNRLLVLVFIFTRLLPRFRLVQQGYHQVLHSVPAFEAVTRLQLLLEQDRESAPPAVVSAIPLRREVHLDRVSYRYEQDSETATVANVDLVVTAGCTTAILGPSGSGKSTLADLIMGLLEPDAGRVLIDGSPLSGERLHGWRRSVGYVPQETFLFHDTIRHNLRWARTDATETDLRRALDSASALEFVMALPQGLDTVVGDRGVRLSGGERQRIALARALLREPALLLLDEATSSLDGVNENRILEAVDRLHGNITVVVIAHRISTVRRADHIVVVEDCNIVEAGPWNDLIQRPHGRLTAMNEG